MVAALKPQSTYDPREIRKLFPDFDVTKHQAVWRFVGLSDAKELAKLTPEQERIYEEGSAITHVSKDDPPVLLQYTYANEDVTPDTPLGVIVHHPKFGVALKEEMDKLGNVFANE